MFESRLLPPSFAVLRPTSLGGPSYQLCTAREIIEDNRVFTVIDNDPLAMETQYLHRQSYPEVYEIPIYETHVRNVAQTNDCIRKVYYWNTFHYFIRDSVEIPILGFSRRFFLCQGFMRVLPYGGTSGEMTETRERYEQLETFQKLRIPRETPSRLPSTIFELPPFVQDLIVRDLESRSECCPITMTPYTQIQRIGITQCCHCFEYNALRRWKEEEGTCPLCRSPITLILEKSRVLSE